MRVSVIGTGYVGLVSGTCFADMGHEVCCIDIDEKKIARLEQGECPLFEKGLDELLARGRKQERLKFSTSYESVATSDCVFLAVGTPTGQDGRADLSFLFQAIEQCLEHLREQTFFVIKSTVPVGTHKRVADFLADKGIENEVINNPEFLKEGTAVDDFMRPDRVVIGCHSERAWEAMSTLYAPLVRQGNPIFRMSNVSAELCKYACNSFLATKISFINELSGLCDRMGASIDEVRQGMRSDPRIGPQFLYPGPGFGGSCFPKDLRALLDSAAAHDYPLQIPQAAYEVNREQKNYVPKLIGKDFRQDLPGKIFGVWGAAFKAGTDDVRETPALETVSFLLERGAVVRLYDPEACANFSELLKREEVPNQSNFEICSHREACVEGADALVVMTEWLEFRSMDWGNLRSSMKDNYLYDGRNLYDPAAAFQHGFRYRGVGRP